MTVDAETFIRIWQRSPSAEAAAEQIGCSVNAAYVRAYRYRALGIPLKRAGRYSGGGRSRLDVARLIEVARNTKPIGTPDWKAESWLG